MRVELQKCKMLKGSWKYLKFAASDQGVSQFSCSFFVIVKNTSRVCLADDVVDGVPAASGAS